MTRIKLCEHCGNTVTTLTTKGGTEIACSGSIKSKEPYSLHKHFVHADHCPANPNRLPDPPKDLRYWHKDVHLKTHFNGYSQKWDIRFRLPGSEVKTFAQGFASEDDALAYAKVRIDTVRTIPSETLKKQATKENQVRIRTRAQKPEQAKKAQIVELYTDGSNRGNPGPGGWGALLRCGSHERELSGPIQSATNNIAELTAVIKGLEALKKPCYVRLVSDSKYVVNGVNKWMWAWAKGGWVKPNANQELWKRLYKLVNFHKRVKAEHVKGHSGHPENERVDKLAGMESAAEKKRQQEAEKAVCA